MARLDGNEIRYSDMRREEDHVHDTAALIDSGVFHIFLLAGKKWDVEIDQITEDFRNFVVFHEIPSYVNGSIHAANRIIKSGLVL